MSQKPVRHFLNSRLAGIKVEKCGPRLITLVNSFYACRRRKRTNSSPSGRVPSSLTKFSPEERTACVMRQTITWSRTPRMRPDFDDFMPSAELCVRLLPPVINVIFSLFSFLSFFVLLFSPTTLVRLDHPPLMRTSLNMYVHYTSGLLGQKLYYSLSIKLFTYAFFHMYLFFATICIDIAWLLCLCPTFSLVRLGHKGSASAIVTAGSSGCVPHTE